MATNGHGQTDDEKLIAVERAISGGSRLALDAKNTEPIEDTITSLAELQAQRFRALGAHAVEHAEYIRKACEEHADRLLSDNRKLASLILTAERRMLQDSENFIGAARGGMLEFKLAIAAMVDILIRDAAAQGKSTDSILRRIGAESLELAAPIHTQHGGCDHSFLGMAQDLLVAVRTGAIEQ